MRRPGTWPGRRSGTVVLVALLLLITAYTGRRLWLPICGTALVVSDPLLRADAIVPLAGDAERLGYSVELFQEGYADWFVLTNMPIAAPETTYAELMRRQVLAWGVTDDRIVLLTELVQSTYEEALRVRQLAEERGWRSVLVVTSPYHSRRSRHILRDVFRGSGIEVSVVAVQDSWYDPDSWWTYHSGRRATLSEYLKFALYLGGYR